MAVLHLAMTVFRLRESAFPHFFRIPVLYVSQLPPSLQLRDLCFMEIASSTSSRLGRVCIKAWKLACAPGGEFLQGFLASAGPSFFAVLTPFGGG